MALSKVLQRTIASLAVISWCATAGAAATPQQVENGLLPAVTMVGEPTRAMSILDRMAHHRVPGVSIAVIEGNRVVWSRAYGARRGSERATADTLFQAGSLSKPVAAAAALMLAADGRLGLDRPINLYLRGWQVPENERSEARQVTLRRILSHTSGLGVHGFRGYETGSRVPTLRQILDGQAPANSEAIRLVRTPGSGVRYSGGAYTVLQQAIEDSGGRPFAFVVEERVFRPLGLRDSMFAQPLPEALRSRAAAGHLSDGRPVPGGWQILPELAAAGLWTTAGDLGRFVSWINRGAAGHGHAIARQMLEPQRDADGRPFSTPAGNQVGLGLVLDGEGPSFRFSHAGSNVGQRALMIGFPATGQGAVIMANSDNSPALIQEILRAIAAEYRWPERFHRFAHPVDIERSALQRLAGTYGFAPRERPGERLAIEVRIAARGLRAVLPDGSSHDLRPISSTEFLDPATEMTILIGADGSLRVPAYRISAIRDEASGQ